MTAPLRALFVLPNLQGGGAERTVLTLLRHLDPARVQASLFLLRREGVWWNEVPASVDVVCGTESGRMRTAWPRVCRRLGAVVRAHDVVVGSLELLPTYLAWGAARLWRKPVVGWVHTDLARYLVRQSAAIRLPARRVYRALDQVVLPSGGALRAFEDWLAPARVPAQVIPNPFDASLYAPPAVDSVEPVGDTPLVVATGRLVPEKGFDLLLRAHAQLLARGLAHRLVIVGDGPERAELEQLIATLGVQATVSLPGFVPDPTRFMRQAQLFVLPSRFEGFGLVLLEAMWAGAPIVAADCPGGPGEVLGGGRFGLLVPPEDPAALADAMARVLQSPSLGAQLRAQGSARLADFAPGQVARHWERLLEGLRA